MTSSSDAPRWRPMDLGGSAFAAPAERPGAGLALVPGSPVSAAGGPGSLSSWLPALRTTAEMTAERTRQALEAEAFGRGREEASRTEREKSDARCAAALRAVGLAANHLSAIAAEFAQDRERDLQGLAIAVARHIVQHELTIDPLRVGELVRRALALLPLDHTIEVRLNPEDLHTLAASLEGLRPEGREVKLLWVGDPSIERGGFVAETPHRIVDGRADVALRALYERFDHD